MSQIIYPITHLPPVIDIGKQTEKGVTRIGFDVHEWLDDWPGMKFSVQPTRPGETESYFAASEMVGSVVFWLVGAVDTEKPGSGTVEVLGVTEDERKLSFMCRTSIANTNTATVAEVPEPNQPWVDQVIMAGETAKADAKNAAHSAQEAVQAASDAGQYSANADKQAASAAKSAASAGEAMLAAAQSAEAAEKAKQTAISNADDAEKSAQAADKSASDAAASADAAAKSAAAIPGTSAPFQQLVTDMDGVVKWEERLAYKINLMERTTYLPSDEWTYSDEGYAVGMSEWAATVQEGVDYVVEYNGATYTCKAASDGVVIVLGGNGYPFELIYNPPSLPMIFPTDGSMPSSVEVYKDEVVEHKKTIDPELLPEGIGGGAGLPETADPLKQLVTDEGGKVAWEDRLAYKYTSTQKGYINVYQDVEMVNQDGQYMLLSPPASSPVAGETYTIIIGGNEYTSKCVGFSALADGQEAYVFGNTAIMGDDSPFENPVPGATYLLMLMPGGSDGYYGMVVSADPVDTPVLTIRSTEEVETTTTNIKKVDKELLDVPTPDMKAGVGEDGYIANRPCWVYEMPKDKFYNGPGIVWDGVIEGKEALYMTFNGDTQLVGYKVCPVPMTEHTFYNKLAAWSRSYQYNADGTDAGHKIIATMERVTNGLTAIKQNTGNVLYYSFDADATGGSLAEFSGGGTGVYITPEYAAVAPHIVWATGYITKPLDVGMLPPAETVAGNQTVYYWRWNPSSNSWQAVAIDQLKADFGFVDVVATADGATITAMSMSFDEVNAAVQAGKNVRLKVGAGWMHCSHSTGNEVEFYTIMGTMLYRVIYRKDGTATVHQHALVAD